MLHAVVVPESLYCAAFESSMDALLLLGEGKVAAANATARRLFGGGVPLDGREIVSLLPPSQPDGQPSQATFEQRANAALGGAPQRFMLRCCYPEGGTFVAEITLTSIGAEGGGPALSLAAREVVSRVEIAKDFHMGEEEMRATLEGSPLTVTVVAPDGRFLWSSRSAPSVVTDPIVGRKVFAIAPNAAHDFIKEVIEKVATTGQPMSFELPVTASTGETVWQDIHAGPYRPRGAIEGLVVLSVNIDARKRAQQARAQSEETLRSVVESLPGLIMTLDKDYRITSINRVLPGFSREDAIGANALDYVPPEYRETARRSFEQVFRTGQGTRYETVSVPPSGGSAVWFMVYVGAILKGEEVVALTLATVDITERKRLEEELQQSLGRAQGYAVELEQKNRLLADENAERRRTEEDLRRQREVVSRLSTPIIKAWDGVLVLPIIGALDSERAAHMMERLLAEIAGSRARFAVLDLTGVETMDTATVGYLVNIVRAASLLGSRCLVSGISPVVAQTMIGLGSATQGFQTFGQMQDALKFALREAFVREPVHGR